MTFDMLIVCITVGATDERNARYTHASVSCLRARLTLDGGKTLHSWS